MNNLVEEPSIIRIAGFVVETRFRVLAARVSVEKGLSIFGKLDAAFTAPA